MVAAASAAPDRLTRTSRSTRPAAPRPAAHPAAGPRRVNPAARRQPGREPLPQIPGPDDQYCAHPSHPSEPALSFAVARESSRVLFWRFLAFDRPGGTILAGLRVRFYVRAFPAKKLAFSVA